MAVNEHLTYERDDAPPHLVTLGVAAQGCVLALGNTATFVTIFAVASGASESYLSWAIFASLVVGGIVTAHMATRLGRLERGYILLTGPASPSWRCVCSRSPRADWRSCRACSSPPRWSSSRWRSGWRGCAG